MSFLDTFHSGGGETSSGNSYNHIYIATGATAHLGNWYTLPPESPLSILPQAEDAPFNSNAKQHESTCLEKTRVEVLQEIYDWAERRDKQWICWLSGLAGTGKSTIARTIARKYFDQNSLGASFFFSRGGGDVGYADKFVTTIAKQLASSIPDVRQHICNAIIKRSDIISLSLLDQWHQLVLDPLLKLDGTSCQSSYIVVIDALDECDNNKNVRRIIELLGTVRSLERVRLRVLLTSRPELPIRHEFYRLPHAERYDIVLHNISLSIVQQDILIFIQENLKLIGKENYQSPSWPDIEAITALVQRASGLFIWAATACRFIDGGGPYAKDRLHTLLTGISLAGTPEEHLDRIYITVLQNSILSTYTQQEKEKFCSTLRDILGCVVALFSPLSADSLSMLLFDSKQEVIPLLKDLHAILDIPSDSARQLRLHHPSFRDFLFDKCRCVDSNFWVNEMQVHQILAEKCLLLMSNCLKQGICGIDSPGELAATIETSQVDNRLSAEIQYACLHWIRHTQKSGAQLQDNDKVHLFLQRHLLHWLEALAWMRKIPECIRSIASLESISTTAPKLLEYVHDIKQFVLYNRATIEQHPLQIYYSALVFAPEKSLVKCQFIWSTSKWISKLPHIEDNWGPLLQTLQGHSDRVSSVAFSPDGKQLASASRDTTVRLWDTISGAEIYVLKGHLHLISAVVFSPDGKQLASASDDNTVKLWDASLGTLANTLIGHLGWVNSVVFSPDGKQLASASDDNTVKLWDTNLGVETHTLKAHLYLVSTVVFSPDGKQLASASADGTIRLWCTSTGDNLHVLKGNSEPIKSVAFSPDSKQLASGSRDGIVMLWDPSKGELLKTLNGHMDRVNSIVFSPDGKQLASASYDGTVRLWKTGTGLALYTLKGHLSEVKTVAFTPDSKQLASASHDKTVKLWDTSLGIELSTLKGHSAKVNALAFSEDGKRLASASDDWTVVIWDTKLSAKTRLPQGHLDSVNIIAFSPSGKQLVSASRDGIVKLWDVDRGEALYTLTGHSGLINDVAFSPDNKQLASASGDGTVRLWDTTLGKATKTLGRYSHPVITVRFSPDGKQLALAEQKTIRLFNAITSDELCTIDGHSDSINSVTFSQDGKQLASGLCDRTVMLWDCGTGTAVKKLDFMSFARTFSYTDDGTFLHKNEGLPQSKLPLSLSVKNNWISLGKTNILWLPPEYRPNNLKVCGGSVAFGYVSGRVLIMQFPL